MGDPKNFDRTWLGAWFVFLAILGSLGIPSSWNPFSRHIERLELATYDARVRFQGGVPFHADKIAVVTIDDDTFEMLGSHADTRRDSKWPFPNSFHATVASRLHAWGARAVGFDLLSFASPSRERYAGEDSEFAAMASRTRNIVLSAKFAIQGSESWGRGFRGSGVAGEVWTTPARAFKGIPRGFVNFPIEVNDTVRRYLPFYWRLAIEPINPLGIELLRVASFPGIDLELAPPRLEPPPLLRYFPWVQPLAIAREEIPYWKILLAENQSASGTLAWNELAARVRDRVVLIGPGFIESQDFFDHPFATAGQLTRVPGVYLHAMIANSAFLRASVHRVWPKREQEISLAFLLIGLACSWLISPAPGFFIFLLLAGMYVGVAFWLFKLSLTWLPVAPPLLASFAALVPNLAARLFISERQRLRVKELFSRYVSAEVLAHVQAHPELLKLEGEKREVTVFFSDLKGFTTLSETMSPEELSRLMNEYLTPMTEIIMEHQGYLDKYIGDAIMAVFGAPMADPHHALRACQAAVRQRDRLRRLASELEKTSGARVSARMGLNTGTVCAGNMGSRDRFQYTVMGDVVNQASRFEGANKIFGSAIMIGEATFLAAREHLFARQLARLTVKGKTRGVLVYELLDLKGTVDSETAARLERLGAGFDQALEAFLAGRVPAARDLFRDFLTDHPGDGPAGFYLEECEKLLSQGTPPGFDGGIKLDSK